MKKFYFCLIFFSLIFSNLFANISFSYGINENNKSSIFNTISPFLIDEVKDGKPIATNTKSEELNTTEQALVPNQYIVILKTKSVINNLDNPSSLFADKFNELRKSGVSIEILNEFKYGLVGFTIKVSDNKVIDILRQNSDVLYIEQDKIRETQGHLRGQVIPTGIDRIDADLSSARSGDGYGSIENVDIAVLDTGVSLSHPDLSVYRQVSFVDGITSGDDDNGHGTAVAGLAASLDNNIGIVGVAPGAKIWAVKVFNSTNTGLSSDVIEGYVYVLQHADEIDVANLSFGGFAESIIEQALLQSIVNAGVTVVASAGPGTLDFFPQAYPEVISVSYMYDSDGKCGSEGETMIVGRDDTADVFMSSTVDMVAPGGELLTTYLGKSYALFGESSAAAPLVSGAAALYISNHEDATPAEVLTELQNEGSDPSTNCDGQGHGYFDFDPFIASIPDNTSPPLLYVRDF
jgi:subtilisin